MTAGLQGERGGQVQSDVREGALQGGHAVSGGQQPALHNGQMRYRCVTDRLQIGYRWATDGLQMGYRWATDALQMRYRSATDRLQMGYRWATDGLQMGS